MEDRLASWPWPVSSCSAPGPLLHGTSHITCSSTLMDPGRASLGAPRVAVVHATKAMAHPITASVDVLWCVGDGAW